MTQRESGQPSRAAMIGGAVAGAGLLLAGTAAVGTQSALADDVVPGICTDSVRTIIDTALSAERVAMAFYYTVLTTPAVMRDHRLGGRAASLSEVGRRRTGTPGHVRYLQAALDAEAKHAAMLMAAGASSPVTHAYFPQETFERLGTSSDRQSALGVLDTLEAAFVDAYAVAVSQLLRLGRRDLAGVTARIMGVEAEHRALGRGISGIAPANNLTLESVPFACAGDVGKVLRPFITGHDLPDGSTTIKVPTKAQIARVVGTYGTRLVRTYVM